MKENIILIDWLQLKEWNFQELINKYTNEKWTYLGVNANGSQNGALKKIFSVYFKLFTFSFKIFLNRKKYLKVLAWQQFLGLILVFYFNIFKVKEFPKLYIMTFIYKPKKGLIGKIYFKFIKYILNSKYIEKVICFSNSEIKYYSNLFGVDSTKFEYCLYAVDPQQESLADENTSEEIVNKNYFLSVGRSNRDYPFLIDSLVGTSYHVVILCDKLEQRQEDNIKIYNNVFDEEYLSYLKNCLAVIIPLKDENISSGQFVFLKAMEYGKPVIITENKTIHEYIKNEYNGLVINKDKNSLIAAMEKLLNDPTYYIDISNNAKKHYKENFSFDSFVRSISSIILKE